MPSPDPARRALRTSGSAANAAGRAKAPRRIFWPVIATVSFGVAVGAGWWLGSRPAAPGPATAQTSAVTPGPAVAPLSIGEASVAQLLQGQPRQDWAVHRLQGNPAVVVIEFPGLLAQGLAMNRIAALLEKNGASRERVLDDAELQQLIRASGDNTSTFYLGHDYETRGLARFFTLAQTQGVALAPAELRLRQLLLDAALLVQDSGPAYRAAGADAVVSFSAVQADDPRTEPDEGMDERRRASVLRHELSHGEFFTNAAYRAHCWRFWRALSDEQRAQWRRYLGALGYDGSDETLMVNESQALLMHTPDTRDFHARALGVSATELEALRLRFQMAAP